MTELESVRSGEKAKVHCVNNFFGNRPDELKELRAKRIYDHLMHLDTPYEPIAKATTPDEINRFLARDWLDPISPHSMEEELTWFSAFDKAVLPRGNWALSPMSWLIQNCRAAGPKYTEALLDLDAVRKSLGENKERVLERPIDLMYYDGLTQGQWERVIRGFSAIGCGMERHLEKMAKLAAEKRKKEEEERAKKEQREEKKRQAEIQEEERLARKLVDALIYLHVKYNYH